MSGEHLPVPFTEIQEEFAIETTESISYDELKEKLAKVLEQILMRDTQRLFAYLYRIDVSESKVKAIIHHPDVSVLMADLILQKLMEKAYWRNKYRSNSDNASY